MGRDRWCSVVLLNSRPIETLLRRRTGRFMINGVVKPSLVSMKI
jgi:hypothetical protein